MLYCTGHVLTDCKFWAVIFWFASNMKYELPAMTLMAGCIKVDIKG